MRFNGQHVEQWREEGFVTIPEFFTEEEYLPVLQDYEELYKDADPVTAKSKEPKAEPVGHRFRAAQFQHIHVLPYPASAAINLISLHPELIAFAKALLEAEAVHLYQSHSWAKYTGETDYEQPFHCDFPNHTLTVPGDELQYRTVDFVLYFTHVTEAHGPLRYVTKPDVLPVIGDCPLSLPDEAAQQELLKKERSATVPPGSLVAHSIDTMHRGSNLTAPGGRRFSMTVGYKVAGNSQIGFHVWQAAGHRPWHLIFDHATPEQLACLGVPLPGDRFWTERTLTLTQSRWPEWDMSEYFSAGRASSRADARSSST